MIIYVYDNDDDDNDDDEGKYILCPWTVSCVRFDIHKWEKKRERGGEIECIVVIMSTWKHISFWMFLIQSTGLQMFYCVCTKMHLIERKKDRRRRRARKDNKMHPNEIVIHLLTNELVGILQFYKVKWREWLGSGLILYIFRYV